MDYVTYNEFGALTGSFSQALHPDHVSAYIEVTPEQRATWVTYKANASRNGLEPADPILFLPVVPQRVTRRQAIQALIIRGYDEAIDTYIEAIEDPVQRKLVRAEYKESQDFERYRPLVVQIGAALDLDLDELFTFADTL